MLANGMEVALQTEPHLLAGTVNPTVGKRNVTLPIDNGLNLVEWRQRKEQARGQVTVFGRRLRVSENHEHFWPPLPISSVVPSLMAERDGYDLYCLQQAWSCRTENWLFTLSDITFTTGVYHHVSLCADVPLAIKGGTADVPTSPLHHWECVTSHQMPQV